MKRKVILLMIKILEFDWKVWLLFRLYAALEETTDEVGGRYARAGGRYGRGPR
jgi:hypothetical protein